MRLKNTKGQNIIEYILVTAAVIVVMISIAHPKQGKVKKSLEEVFNTTVDDIGKMRSELKYQ